MLFAIHDKDTGQITQANKVFVEDFKSYGKLLGDLGHCFVKENRAALLPPEYWYVNIKTRRINKRPRMRAAAQARFVKAGTPAVITNIQKGASIDILAAGETIWSLAAPDGDELQFTMPDYPCTYRVIIRLWPYRDCVIDIEGVK
jgi:hypothetical protein